MADNGIVLSDDAFKELREIVTERRKRRQPVQVTEARRYDPPPVTFFAKLTAHSVITTDVRWLYTFVEVAATPTFAVGGVLTGVSFATFTGARTGKCINLAEWGNDSEPSAGTPWYLNDVDAHGTGYAATVFQLMPIGGGGTTQTHKVDRVVQITRAMDAASGYQWWWFDRQNVHDGNCS